MSNAIKAENGIEVYEHDIKYYADEYISQLPEKEDSINNNPSLFTGMIKYIYKHLFKPGKKDKVKYNANTNLDTGDIELLNNIWEVYTELCYKYNKRPTILNFSLLIGIDNRTIDTWRRGEFRAGEDGASSAHSQTVKKWLAECESSLVDGATERNSVGCIFALKANYGYTETPQRVEIVNGQQPEQIAADIAARHKIGQVEKPELPEDL
ncbi:hypothetical protein [Blautia hydrogenotrophica]|jgi:hypothetical protein|uniref:Uncharacterized protein n=1 Tax=Blautia hydrogenotrophica (strain DSM 10507 / JCM 14656 / S5a33) TaxID=476272 RepID=C0CM32_BLAHS|nr:hypothetical protein [Blautia hydrogenotrophica]SCI27680.1 Uncharacterised protein [uncultured Blautia sp.]DAU19189.1 MAG TPA: hypothetical protein [Caudoviricetes sp.]EEG49102.1 hypothetical protein RUMHYD_01907 [Blautia hydrogenotrophica DSM 10507]MCT6798011.1 hypothetical protein [Blautia hydrogenotrophica]WPX84309.1 hypothetical protein BLHYD_23240 [Blautia hydrogenotrophica DSM 10507]